MKCLLAFALVAIRNQAQAGQCEIAPEPVHDDVCKKVNTKVITRQLPDEIVDRPVPVPTPFPVPTPRTVRREPVPTPHPSLPGEIKHIPVDRPVERRIPVPGPVEYKEIKVPVTVQKDRLIPRPVPVEVPGPEFHVPRPYTHPVPTPVTRNRPVPVPNPIPTPVPGDEEYHEEWLWPTCLDVETEQQCREVAGQVICDEPVEKKRSKAEHGIALGNCPQGSWAGICTGNGLIDMIGGSLHAPGGRMVPTAEAVAGMKHVILYFAASWCPHCRKFTPKLVEAHKKSTKPVTIIWVSKDKEQAKFEEYYRNHGGGEGMPFYAMPFDNLNRGPWLAMRFEVKHLPTLVVLDAYGNLVEKEGMKNHHLFL